MIFDTKAAPAIERMVTLGLTARQAQVYLYLFSETARLGYQPSFRAVGAAFGFAGASGTANHYEVLRRKGWIENADGDSRAVRFVRCPDGSPFLGFTTITREVACEHDDD